MLLLTFHGDSGDPGGFLEGSDFRLTGGALWDPIEHGLIAYHNCGSWKHQGCHYREISITGECCLVFGTVREPSPVSDPITLLTLSGTTLFANGVAVADYDERADMWQGRVRPIGRRSMRLICASAVSALIDTQAVRLNPLEGPRLQDRLIVAGNLVNLDSTRESGSGPTIPEAATKPT